jgi:Rap1a immunity proteins
MCRIGLAKIFAILVMISQPYTGSAQAQPSTQMVEARELIAWSSDGSAEGSAACIAYIMGIADAVSDPKVHSCPGSATRNQIRAAVMQHLARSPGLDLPAALYVTAALQSAFPCPRRWPQSER